MSGRYRTIVADPPWPMPETGRRTSGPKDDVPNYESESGRKINGEWWARFTGESVRLPYETLTLEEIAALPVAELAEPDAHLYLWTTNRFLWDARKVAEAWGFKFSTVLTWCKPPIGMGFGGAYALTSEFVLFCRRGSLAPQERHDSTWMQWSRPYENGHIAHSTKPDAFLDLVEKVSPGPYVELFARRARFGWDYFGDESLGTASMPGGSGVSRAPHHPAIRRPPAGSPGGAVGGARDQTVALASKRQEGTETTVDKTATSAEAVSASEDGAKAPHEALREFVVESNRIEGIVREPTDDEIAAHAAFMVLREVHIADLESFVAEVAQATLRSAVGFDVFVGNHRPPPGGPAIRTDLQQLLADIHCFDATPYEAHVRYETLHPFTDGNGRSGRALWAWQMRIEGHDPFALPFLHRFYYQSLDGSRAA